MNKMKKFTLIAASVLSIGAVAFSAQQGSSFLGMNATAATTTSAETSTAVYRAYNPNNGEHFYTESNYEAQSLKSSGWNLEGVGWNAPTAMDNAPVYRLYNPNSGYHFYTKNSYEKNSLVKDGWKYENVSFRSGGTVAVYRAYNPNSGLHNYTSSKYEQTNLIKAGWKDEGIAWYGTKEQATVVSEKVPVQILGINDFHGNIATADQKVTIPAITGDPTGKTTDYTGTAALLAGYLNKYSQDFMNTNKNGITFRMEAGDMVGASPSQSGLIYDQPTLASLHAMNIQVGSLGNHEFDRGLPDLAIRMAGKDPVSNPTSSLDVLAAKFYTDYNYTPSQLGGGYQYLVANVVDKSDGKTIPNGYQPYTIMNEKTADGKTVKVGVIGVVTTQTAVIALHDNVKDYDFTDPAVAIAKYSKELQSQGVNAIVICGHTGSTNVNNDPSQPVIGETSDIIKELNTIDPNNSVDLFVAGHSHTFTNGVVDENQAGKDVHPIRVVQAMSFGMAFDNIDATYDTATNDFTGTPNASIVPATDYSIDASGNKTYSKVEPDTAVADIVNNAVSITNSISSQPIGSYASGASYIGGSPVLSSGRSGYSAFLPVPSLPTIPGINQPDKNPTTLGESLLGQFITKAQYETANDELGKQGIHVDAAITNNGGIRADLNASGGNGQITWGDAQAVQPFRNVIQVVSMTGAQILAALNEQTYNAPDPGAGSGLYLQEYGINYTVTTNPNINSGVHPNMEPYAVTNMTWAVGPNAGKAVDLSATYNVAINNFLRGGGDGFEAFARPSVKDIAGFQEDDTDVFIDYIQKIGTIPTMDQFLTEKTFTPTGTPIPDDPTQNQ